MRWDSGSNTAQSSQTVAPCLPSNPATPTKHPGMDLRARVAHLCQKQARVMADQRAVNNAETRSEM